MNVSVRACVCAGRSETAAPHAGRLWPPLRGGPHGEAALGSSVKLVRVEASQVGPSRSQSSCSESKPVKLVRFKASQVGPSRILVRDEPVTVSWFESATRCAAADGGAGSESLLFGQGRWQQ